MLLLLELMFIHRSLSSGKQMRRPDRKRPALQLSRRG
jgi:hypothetical protein